MFESIAEWVVKILERNNIISQERSIYKYGVELFVSSVIGRSIVLLIGIIFNQFIFAVIYEIMFIFTRGNFGGYHCKSYAKCIISYLILYLLSIFIVTYCFIDSKFIVIMLALCNYIIISYCPVRNVMKQLSENEYSVHKVKSIAKSILISLLILFTYLYDQGISNYIFTVYTIIIILVIGGKIEYEKIKS